MPWGQHYIFCAVCGIKQLVRDAKLDEEQKWICKRHELEDLYDRGATAPVISPTYPQIVRQPRRPNASVGSPLTWDIIHFKWEDLNINWEDL